MTDASDPAEAAARRSRLVGVKLRALVADHTGSPVGEPVEFSPGAALVDGGRAWVFVDHEPERQLGAAIAWAIRHQCDRLDLIADDRVGLLARRAAQFSMPINVWQADDRALVPAAAEALPTPSEPPEHHDVFRQVIIDGGAMPIVEHGVLIGEVRGLEVCRVVDDVVTGSTRLEVGVGAHDREAFQMLHGDVPTVESLARIVESVAAHRGVDAPPHPLNRLGAERLIRWRLTEQPELVDAAVLAPAVPPVPRKNLKDSTPCVATGVGADGEPVTVVCSSGIDLDVVPFAADAHLAASRAGVGGGRLVVAMPARDRIKLVDEVASLLRYSVSFVSVD